MISGRDKTIKNLKDKRTVLDIVKTRANIELELGTFWVNDNNYGFLWYVKRIEILSALEYGNNITICIAKINYFFCFNLCLNNIN